MQILNLACHFFISYTVILQNFSLKKVGSLTNLLHTPFFVSIFKDFPHHNKTWALWISKFSITFLNESFFYWMINCKWWLYRTKNLLHSSSAILLKSEFHLWINLGRIYMKQSHRSHKHGIYLQLFEILSNHSWEKAHQHT